jgi:NAD(P)-dependent dehydrogenase (short-subunit alcohol dehydrogenase family)
MGRLTGKTAVITGGNSGIGLATAEAVCIRGRISLHHWSASEALLAGLANQAPLERIGDPDETAAVALFLASADSGPPTTFVRRVLKPSSSGGPSRRIDPWRIPVGPRCKKGMVSSRNTVLVVRRVRRKLYPWRQRKEGMSSSRSKAA